MKAAEIRELRDDELRDKLDDVQMQLFSLRTQAVTENLENRHAINNVKRDVARIKTIMKERQLSPDKSG
jgi:large subunit ribosomal protein L29